MADDRKEELERLEQALLEQEDDSWLDLELQEAHLLLNEEAPEAEPEEAEAEAEAEDDEDVEEEEEEEEASAPEAAPDCTPENTDRVDVDLEDFSNELLEEAAPAKKEGIKPLVILIIAELVAIAGIGLYWVLQL